MNHDEMLKKARNRQSYLPEDPTEYNGLDAWKKEGNGMKKIIRVYDAWKAGILDKFLAGEDESDHSSTAILNVPTPVDWVGMARRVWGTYDELDGKEKYATAVVFDQTTTVLEQ